MVDLGKSAAGDEPDDVELVVVVRPRIVLAILWATIAWAVFAVIGSLTVLLSQDWFHDYFIRINNKAKTKKANFTGQTVDNYVHSFTVYGIISTSLVGLVLVMLAGLTVRGKGQARWALFALATGLPALVCAVLPVGVIYHTIGVLNGYPVAYRTAQALCLLFSLVVVSLTMHKETRAWFRAIAPAMPKRGLFGFGASSPAASGAGNVERPTVAGMLLGRRPVRPAPTTTSVTKIESERARTKRSNPRVENVKPKGDSGPGRSKSRQR